MSSAPNYKSAFGLTLGRNKLVPFIKVIIKNLAQAQPLGSVQISKSLGISSSKLEAVSIGKGTYTVCNLCDCLIIMRTPCEFEPTICIFNRMLYIDGDHLCGFFDYDMVRAMIADDPNHSDSEEDGDSMCEIRDLTPKEREGGCMLTPKDLLLDTKNIDTPIGCVIDSDCGTAFPLPLFVNKEKGIAVILTGRAVESLVNDALVNQ